VRIGKGFAAALLGAALSPGAAQAQTLVGAWQTSQPQTPNSPAFAITVRYTPNGLYLSETAIAPRPGLAGGTIQTQGSYVLQGDSTVTVTFGNSVMCAAGTPCQPAPPQLVPPPGSSQSFTFSFQGQNQLVTRDGTVFVRLQ